MPPIALLAGAILLSSCGGGGGSNLPTPTATTKPSAVYAPTGCDATTYSPNYISSNTNDNGFSYWRHFPITVYIAPVDDATRATTLAGFNEWVVATDGRASYKLVSSTTGADLSVSYAPNNQPVGMDGYYTVGLTSISDASATDNHIITTDAPKNKNTMQLFILNPDGSPVSADNANGTNQSIAAHEFGHALGIGPHSLVTDDLMYKALHADNGVEAVTARDLNTLKSIYCNNFPTATSSALERKSAASGDTVRSRTFPPFRRANRS